MEVPRLAGESELKPPAHTTTTATQDPSPICDLPHSSQQRRILNSLSEARDPTRVLMDANLVGLVNHCATVGNSQQAFFNLSAEVS